MTLTLGSRSNNVFFVNASSPEPLDIATSKFAGALVWMLLGNILCDLDPKVKFI